VNGRIRPDRKTRAHNPLKQWTNRGVSDMAAGESAVDSSRTGFLCPGNPINTLKKVGIHVQVLVRDNNVDQALRALKKKMQREGIFREMKMRGHYEKPSEKRAREKAEAVRRTRKLARKRAQREGLLGGRSR
jgi:small subunit ribosomal protein S21